MFVGTFTGTGTGTVVIAIREVDSSTHVMKAIFTVSNSDGAMESSSSMKFPVRGRNGPLD